MDTTKTIVIKKTSQNKAAVNLPKFYATGRRKEAAARVWVFAGTGKIIINNKYMDAYFSRSVLRMLINQPFAATNTTGKFDVVCTVKGSGLSGQAGAIRHGISRALSKVDSGLHAILRRDGFMTRDPREVERKKYAKLKARCSPQFSKR